MPRRAREKSNSGIYHVMVRGINRQDIFNDEDDKLKYLFSLKEFKNISGCHIYGYCLMSNHVHLLLREGNEQVAQFMKRMGASYVYWHNMKYDRCGHLFQDRFKSENVEDDTYLLAVLRYIHQNPIKAGMVEKLTDYKWSSYGEYLREDGLIIGEAEKQFVFGLFDANQQKATETFKEFMGQENEDTYLDDVYIKRKMLPDEDARALIKKITGMDSPQMLQGIFMTMTIVY